MDSRARFDLTARRVAVTAALVAVSVPLAAVPAQGATKKKQYPTISSVRPLSANVGETLTIRGKNFRKGKNKNAVVFKRDGAKAVFVTAELSTTKVLRVKLPKRLENLMTLRNGVRVPTLFRVRVLSSRLGRKYTSLAKSPTIGPELPKGADGNPIPPPVDPNKVDPDSDCDGDRVKDITDSDDDNDLLEDTLEASLKLDRCKPDTDGDGVEDGFEYKSATDLNDDDYQTVNGANGSLPHPAKLPYPNPLDPKDATTDFDRDSLTLTEEFKLWLYTISNGSARTLAPLEYSDGEQYSILRRCAAGDADARCGANDVGRRIPTLAAAGYPKLTDFLNWATQAGYRTVELNDGQWHNHSAHRNTYGLLDFNRDSIEASPGDLASINNPQTFGAGPGIMGFYKVSETFYWDLYPDGWLSDDERDEDADGLTNFDESHGRMTQAYWTSCYGVEKAHPRPHGTVSMFDADSDGDGVRDGADDSDFDDIPNLMELSRNAASGHLDIYADLAGFNDGAGSECKLPEEPELAENKQHHPDVYGRVNPFNPCLPDTLSRTCELHPGLSSGGAPFDGSPNWLALN